MTKKKDDMDAYASRVAGDHYLHILALLATAAYAWQLHGGLVGFLLLVGLWATITMTNLVILSKFGSLRIVRFNRWFWVALALVGLAASGASIESLS